MAQPSSLLFLAYQLKLKIPKPVLYDIQTTVTREYKKKLCAELEDLRILNKHIDLRERLLEYLSKNKMFGLDTTCITVFVGSNGNLDYLPRLIHVFKVPDNYIDIILRKTDNYCWLKGRYKKHTPLKFKEASLSHQQLDQLIDVIKESGIEIFDEYCRVIPV